MYFEERNNKGIILGIQKRNIQLFSSSQPLTSSSSHIQYSDIFLTYTLGYISRNKFTTQTVRGLLKSKYAEKRS